MSTYPSDVVLIILVGTLLLLFLASFITSLVLIYKQRHRAHQQQLVSLQELYQRELLQSQLEIQNQTLQQIAHELHDNIGQLLTVVVMQLNTLEIQTAESTAQQSVQQTRDLVRTTIAGIRTLSKTLDYDTVGRFGLLPSLELELDRIRRATTIQTEVIPDGEPYVLNEKITTVLFRMAQESLNNALKHAQAQNLQIYVTYHPDSVLLAIVDDGKGFEMGGLDSRALNQSGTGLSHLYRRAELLGGSCEIISQPDAGTRVAIRIPRNQPV